MRGAEVFGLAALVAGLALLSAAFAVAASRPHASADAAPELRIAFAGDVAG